MPRRTVDLDYPALVFDDTPGWVYALTGASDDGVYEITVYDANGLYQLCEKGTDMDVLLRGLRARALALYTRSEPPSTGE